MKERKPGNEGKLNKKAPLLAERGHPKNRFKYTLEKRFLWITYNPIALFLNTWSGVSFYLRSQAFYDIIHKRLQTNPENNGFEIMGGIGGEYSQKISDYNLLL